MGVLMACDDEWGDGSVEVISTTTISLSRADTK